MVMTNKQLVYLSSVLCAVALIAGMTTVAVVFGVGAGIQGTELYIATKDSVEKDECYHTLAWYHVSYGIAAILSGFISGITRCVLEILNKILKLTLAFNNVYGHVSEGGPPIGWR